MTPRRRTVTVEPTTAPVVMPRGPIAATEIWQAVIGAAGLRCTCTGACGRSHARTQGRCPVATLAARLYAAPADSTVPTTRAHEVPVTELTAWCGPCLDGARRRHTPPPDPAPAPDGCLFDLTDDDLRGNH